MFFRLYLIGLSIVLSIIFSCSDNPTSQKNTKHETGTLTDIDGNVYQTIRIGNQWWMAENLKVIHYRNNEAIPNVTDNVTWSGLSTGAYSNYDNNADTAAIYGRLYNWYAVDDSRKIAPEGWHVPSDEEWVTLVDYLGGNFIAGDKMKEAGTVHWASPNTGATNESGFSALPGGCRFGLTGIFVNVGFLGTWWSASEYSSTSAWFHTLEYSRSFIDRGSYDKRYGSSVRCIRD